MICENCGKEFPSRITIDGKSRVLSKRKYCLECSPFGVHNTKKLNREYKCSRCGETDPKKFIKGRYTECKKCRNEYNNKKNRSQRERVVEYLGGKCACCGYDKYICSLDIHHLDPSTKDKYFDHYSGWSWDRLEKEVSNCILLCRNCHTAFHSGYITEDDFKYVSK